VAKLKRVNDSVKFSVASRNVRTAVRWSMGTRTIVSGSAGSTIWAWMPTRRTCARRAVEPSSRVTSYSGSGCG
jgi:hypothetical protein